MQGEAPGCRQEEQPASDQVGADGLGARGHLDAPARLAPGHIACRGGGTRSTDAGHGLGGEVTAPRAGHADGCGAVERAGRTGAGPRHQEGDRDHEEAGQQTSEPGAHRGGHDRPPARPVQPRRVPRRRLRANACRASIRAATSISLAPARTQSSSSPGTGSGASASITRRQGRPSAAASARRWASAGQRTRTGQRAAVPLDVVARTARTPLGGHPDRRGSSCPPVRFQRVSRTLRHGSKVAAGQIPVRGRDSEPQTPAPQGPEGGSRHLSGCSAGVAAHETSTKPCGPKLASI